MAEKSGSDESHVELRRRSLRSRELVRDVGGLRYELNFPLKFKKSFQRNTVFWVGAALAVGLLIALLRARTHKVYVSAAGKKVRSPDKKLLESAAFLGALKLGLTRSATDGGRVTSRKRGEEGRGTSRGSRR